MLTVFCKTLAPGSVRLKLYDTAIKKARKLNRLPQESREAYNELIAKLKKTSRETKMKRQESIEKAFEGLTMGRLAHSA